MTLTIHLTMDSVAFDPIAGDEAARILAHLARQFAEHDVTTGQSGTLRDYNGNTVGSWGVAQ